MNIHGFIKKWSRSQLSERAASQEHFLDLCRLLSQPTPAEHDAEGNVYAFEKSVKVAAPASVGSKGERGFADVWWKGKFGWEYKRKDKYKTLDDAYRQLLQYREALENPKLLIVSDIARTEIHTNFTGYKSDVHVVELDRLDEPEQLNLLRRVFTDPDSFIPDETAEQVTEIAAKAIGEIAQGLRERGHDPHDAAHFLMKVMFCLFAEDVELLPKGLFEKMLGNCRYDPPRLKSQMDSLFTAMRTGGDFGIEQIAYFNGGLFDDAQALELTETDIASLVRAASKDWGAVEPSVFGTLFERSLDPDKRAQIGAHYTSRDDIMLVIEPVIVRPLRKQWDAVREQCEQLAKDRATAQRETDKKSRAKGALKPATITKKIEKLLFDFQHHLATVKVLDPACGSGNFLYVAIQQLLGLEKEVLLFAADLGSAITPRVRPTQLLGIEINPYASELAQVVIWIGYLQWMRDNGFNAPRDPILEPIETIENRDAILAWEDEQGEPIQSWRDGAVCKGQAEWPAADFIVGNPPFLGSTKFAEYGISEEYKDAYEKHHNLRGKSDLCCAWFEHARWHVRDYKDVRVGLLGNTTIRYGVARDVLDRVSDDAVIFEGWSNKKWFDSGTSVRTCIVCFTNEEPTPYQLDGIEVEIISSSLLPGIDLNKAMPIPSNKGHSFEGDQKGGPFDLNWDEARSILATPSLAVDDRLPIRRRMNLSDVTKSRYKGGWVIDFGPDASEEYASRHQIAFEFLKNAYEEARAKAQKKNKPFRMRKKWWIHKCARPEMLRALSQTKRSLVTGRVGRHRIFRHLTADVLVDSRLFAFSRDDNFFFGILQSEIHSLWALKLAPPHGVGNDPTYNNTTCFETFPLPWSPGAEPSEADPQRPLHDAIADAAEQLNTQRERWLNPPEWIDEIARQIDEADDFADVARVSGEEARRLIRRSAIDAAAAKDPQLKKRTLTNLYNERPTWLALAHQSLDEAVLNAYAAIDPEGGWDEAWAQVFTETGAGQPLPEKHDLTERREEIEQRILANLLRLNLSRAAKQ